jgi:hypothetical protein
LATTAFGHKIHRADLLAGAEASVLILAIIAAFTVWASTFDRPWNPWNAWRLRP